MYTSNVLELYKYNLCQYSTKKGPVIAPPNLYRTEKMARFSLSSPLAVSSYPWLILRTITVGFTLTIGYVSKQCFTRPLCPKHRPAATDFVHDILHSYYKSGVKSRGSKCCCRRRCHFNLGLHTRLVRNFSQASGSSSRKCVVWRFS